MKPKTDVQLEPVMGTSLVRVDWTLPMGHGCDEPEHIARSVDAAIRTYLDGLNLECPAMKDIRIEPIWTEPCYPDALLNGHNASAEEIADFLRRAREQAAHAVIDLLGEQDVAEALARRCWAFVR